MPDTTKFIRHALTLGSVRRVILTVTDMERAIRFYSATLGIPVLWKSREWTELGTRQVELCLHAGRGDSSPGQARVVFQVDDFDQAYYALRLREVPALGQPYSPSEGVRCASFADPDGNPLGIEGR